MAGLMDLAEDVKNEFGVTKAEARKVIEFICGRIVDYMGAGKDVSIRGFGVFKTKEMEARTIKSPRDRKEVLVDPTVRCLFTPAKKTKTELKYQRGLITEEAYQEAMTKSSSHDAADADDEDDPVDQE